MIKREFYKTRSDGIALYITYSDANLMIRQVETGAVYSEAIDVDGAPYTYEETDTLIEDGQSEDDALQAVKILLGEETE